MSDILGKIKKETKAKCCSFYWKYGFCVIIIFSTYITFFYKFMYHHLWQNFFYFYKICRQMRKIRIILVLQLMQARKKHES